jgi:hypothetical protein
MRCCSSLLPHIVFHAKESLTGSKLWCVRGYRFFPVIRLKEATLVAELPKDFSDEGQYVTSLIEDRMKSDSLV